MTPFKTTVGRVAGWAAWGLLIAWGPATVGAAPSLRDVLSPEEFERAGLGKLTPAELEFLSARLLPSVPPAAPAAAGESQAAPVEAAPRPVAAERSAPPAAAPAAATFGREKQVQAELEKREPAAREMQARLSGAFTGWTGRTVFRLDNGQVWQQVEPGLFSVRLESPVVTIRKGRFGAFYLGVEGYGSQVKVKRLQ